MAYTAKLLLVPFGFCTLFAQQSTPSTIQVTGRATVSAAPDQALMTVGVTTSAESAQEAASKNAALADALIMRIRNSFGEKVDVETASYSVMQEPEPRPQEPVQGREGKGGLGLHAPCAQQGQVPGARDRVLQQ